MARSIETEALAIKLADLLDIDPATIDNETWRRLLALLDDEPSPTPPPADNMRF